MHVNMLHELLRKRPSRFPKLIEWKPEVASGVGHCTGWHMLMRSQPGGRQTGKDRFLIALRSTRVLGISDRVIPELSSFLSQLTYLCVQTSFSCSTDIYHLSSSDYIPLLHVKHITLKCDSGRVFLQRGRVTRLTGTSIGPEFPRSVIQTHLQICLN